MRLRLLIITVLVMAVAVPAFAVQRTVLVENFTNTGCPGCSAIKDSMDAIFAEYEGMIVPIKYHVNWPASGDPFYLYNPTEVTLRRSYYGVNYVPTFRFEGKYLNDPSDFMTYDEWYSFVRSTLDSLYAIPSPVRLDVNHWRDNDSIYVKVDVVVTDSLSNPNMNLFWVLKTSWKRIPGQGKWYNVFRDMIPNTTGEALTLAYGDSLHFDWAVKIDTSLNENRFMNAVFLQRSTSKNVVQAWDGLVPEPTDVAAGVAPLRVMLDQNAPNPFNPTTTIRYALDERGPVRLAVYGPSGRLVADLVNEVMGEGAHAITWDGRDRSGREVASGVYYYRLDAGETALTKKMVLIR